MRINDFVAGSTEVGRMPHHFFIRVFEGLKLLGSMKKPLEFLFRLEFFKFPGPSDFEEIFLAFEDGDNELL